MNSKLRYKIKYGLRSLLALTVLISVLAWYEGRKLEHQAHVKAVLQLICKSEQEFNNIDPTSLARCINALNEFELDVIKDALHQIEGYECDGFLTVLFPFLFEQNAQIPLIPAHEFALCDGLLFRRYSVTQYARLDIQSIDLDELRLRHQTFSPTDDLITACEQAITLFEKYDVQQGRKIDPVIRDLTYLQAFECIKHLYQNSIEHFEKDLASGAVSVFWDSTVQRYATTAGQLGGGKTWGVEIGEEIGVTHVY